MQEPSAATRVGEHSTLGQKVRGTIMEAAGTVSGNETKRQEGKALRHGLEPTTHH